MIRSKGASSEGALLMLFGGLERELEEEEGNSEKAQLEVGGGRWGG